MPQTGQAKKTNEYTDGRAGYPHYKLLKWAHMTSIWARTQGTGEGGDYLISPAPEEAEERTEENRAYKIERYLLPVQQLRQCATCVV